MATREIAQRYTIQDELGAGGMGTVYLGVDTRTQQPVAIKQLKSQIAQPHMIERFKREGEALRELNHPNIVKMLDAVKENGDYFLVMEYVSGGDLRQLMEEGHIQQSKVVSIALDLSDALTRAHRLNIIHRDLKPANVLIADDGTPRLTDFGVAHTASSHVTETGALVGTLAYLSPEMLIGAQPSTGTDIWALGVLMVELLSGQHPFQAEHSGTVINAILHKPLPDLEELCPDAPTALVDLLYRMMAKNPDERIPSIRLVGAELEAILQGSSLTPISTQKKYVAANSVFATTPVSESATPNNLPSQSTPFVGREKELDLLKNLLSQASTRLVTIVGPGGMGKTRLSLETASNLLQVFPDGVYFVELAPLSASESIPMAVAEAVGYPFQSDGGSPVDQLIEYFREKQQLLVLDNFEHVMDGRDFVRAIIQGAPGLKIIVTSRERLNITAENVFQLEGIDFPDWETPDDAMRFAAMQLFLESARRVQPGLELSVQDLPYAARICRMVRGLPLALVLAGAWLEMLSVKEVAEEMARNLDFLESPLQDVPERHRTIRAVFDYSWQLLNEAEQEAFTRLSVFRGGMTRQAAQAVADANLRTLQALVNKSILRRNTETGRYEVHELLRQFAYEILVQAGKLPTIMRKHSDYFAEYLKERDTQLKDHRQLTALNEIEVDFENIKAVWHYACAEKRPDTIESMVEAIFWFCNFRSRNMEGADLFHVARQLCRDESAMPPLVVGKLMVRYPEGSDLTSLLKRGLELATLHEDQPEIAFCNRQLGHWYSHSQMDQDKGIPLLETSLKQYEDLGDQFYIAILLDDLGWSYNLSGDRTKQAKFVEECLAIRRQIGDKIGIANALRNMGGATGGIGTNSPEPLQYWQEALKLAYEIGDRSSIAWNHALISMYWQFLGEFEKCRADREAARKIAREINDRVIYGVCLLQDALEETLINQNYVRARELIHEAYPDRSAFDMRVFPLQALDMLLAAVEQDVDTLRRTTQFMATLTLGWRHPILVTTVFICSVVYHMNERYEDAAEMIGLFTREPHFPLYSMLREWPWLIRFTTDLKSKLDDEAYQAAIARGSSLDLLEVVEKISNSL